MSGTSESQQPLASIQRIQPLVTSGSLVDPDPRGAGALSPGTGGGSWVGAFLATRNLNLLAGLLSFLAEPPDLGQKRAVPTRYIYLPLLFVIFVAHPPSATAASGRDLFLAECAGCHGEKGDGKGAADPDLER